MSSSNTGPIPKRWLNCPRISKSFIADKFFAFKTPLAEKFKDQIPFRDSFPAKMVYKYIKDSKKRLGLWIDLTNTSRFYDKKEIEDFGCTYIKLQCRGHGETPSVEQTKSFINIVETFIASNPLDIIAVHCTHGFNRTGFMIISYMVDKMDCAVDAALMAFAQARPPGIYKGDYIKELYLRYQKDEDEEVPPPPALPQWCLELDESDNYQHGNKHKLEYSECDDGNHNEEYEEDDDDEGEDDDTNEGEGPQKYKKDGESSQPPRKKQKRNLASFMAGINGVELVTEAKIKKELKLKCRKMCRKKLKGFPGCQPVSMDVDNIVLLKNKPYQVSWKADGTRYMMLIKERGEIYFFDRDYSVFKVKASLNFPTLENLNEHITNTLIDGEMVIDVENGVSIPRYLVYDIITYQDEDVSNLPFYPDRLTMIRKYIIEPRYKAMKYALINKLTEPFSVRDKKFFNIIYTSYLLGPEFNKTLFHKPDGLIFQPANEPYVPGCCQEVLKWKPGELNSIDFKLQIEKETGVGIVPKKQALLYVGGYTRPFGKIKYTRAIERYDNKIIECKYLKHCEFEFMRERTDKSFPNSLTTAQSVYKSITNPVTQGYLLGYIAKNRFTNDDDSKKMPPPQNKTQ